MNTAFGGNQVGSRVSLDIAGAYPTGLMAALGYTYNTPQQLINSQLRYTAAQVDINAQQDAAYAQSNLQIERTATLAVNNLPTQVASAVYKNASQQVNYANQNLSDTANTAYTNAHAVYKVCSDASYTAYLTQEASQIVVDRVAAELITSSVAMSVPDVSPIDIARLSTVSTLVGNHQQDAHNATILAQSNAQQYLTKTQNILANAIVKSNTVTNNLKVVAAFNTLVKSVIQNLADPLNYISGKETLVTQYIPSVPLNNAIRVANFAIAALKGWIAASSANVLTNATITSNIASSTSLATSLDTLARGNDSVMDLTDATANLMIRSASTMKGNGSSIYIAPSSDSIFNPYFVSLSSISTARSAKKVALDADTSASNARRVSNALISLQTAFASNLTPEPSVAICSANSLIMLDDAMAAVNKLTSNTSAYTGVAVSIRSSNTVNRLLSEINDQEEDSVSAAADSKTVLDLLRAALTMAVVTDLDVTKRVAWAVNAATGKAEENSEKAKNKAFLLSRTAHALVTPQSIAVQTASANSAGALNNNRASRLDRLSRNPPVDPPPPYKSFNAGIRAQTFQPVRPSLDELVFKNRLAPLRLDSLRTILDTKVKVARDVQRINDISAFSFKQQ